MPIINNQQIAQKIRAHYAIDDIRALRHFLNTKGTFRFASLPNGLFPAATSDALNGAPSGYDKIWVRDNVYIAFSHFCQGQVEIAAQNTRALLAYFLKYQNRFEEIIAGRVDPQQPMNRPQIRFDGRNLAEVDQVWAHAQNDALGYFLWFYCRLVNHGVLQLDQATARLLAIFALFFEKIEYWQDQDSGHWEEVRKQSASSIGVVTASLHELKKLLLNRGRCVECAYQNRNLTVDYVQQLIDRGEHSLNEILPAECVQAEQFKHRPHDAALLFLIYPLEIVQGERAESIIENVTRYLQGEYGIRRYLGDSYWAPDYKKMLAPERRTQDFSNNIADRDVLLATPGSEAQWCIFDPILSMIYGKKYLRSGKQHDLEYQTTYLNRSLGQITGARNGCEPFRCPELYYRENGHFVPNDHVPLYWTQANLMMALHMMEINLQPGLPLTNHQNGKAKIA